MLVDEIAGMPQTTRLSVEKPSNRPAKYKTYNKNNFVSAVADVNDNNVSCAEAAKKWSVNGRTLQEHIAKLRKGIPIRKAGAPTTLTATEEQSIENWAKLCGLLGFPATKRSVIAKAQQILKTRNASFKSKTGRASRSWWRSFRKRHPGVKYVRPKALKRELAAVTREAIQSFYVELNRVRNLYSIRDDMVFNLDETGVSRLGEDDSKVLVDKDSDAVRITLEFRQHVSVVLCVNAQGVAMPPLFLYKGVEGLKPAHLESLQKGAIHGSQFAQTGLSELILCCLTRSVPLRQGLHDQRNLSRVAAVFCRSPQTNARQSCSDNSGQSRQPIFSRHGLFFRLERLLFCALN
jgi:hypothetical protein